MIRGVKQIAEVGKSVRLADSSCLSALLIITLSAFMGPVRGVQPQTKAPLIARSVAGVFRLMSADKGSLCRENARERIKWLRMW